MDVSSPGSSPGGWGPINVTTQRPIPAHTCADSATELEVPLRDLGFAVKSLQLYPPTSPVVKGAIERSYRSLAPLLGNGYLCLEITPRLVRVNEREVGAGTPVVEQLARRMHSRGIARLHLDSRLEPASLQKLSEIVAAETKVIEELGGIEKLFEEKRPRGVLADLLELERLFADEQEDEEENIWESILRGYRLAGPGDEDVDWNALAMHVDRLQDFVGWLAANLEGIAERTGFEDIDVMRFVLDRLGGIAAALSSEHVSFLVLALRQAFDQLDPGMLVELLADPVEVEVEEDDTEIAELSVSEFLAGAPAPTPKKRTIDIGTYIASGLDSDQAERLILHTLHTRQRSSPRLYRLFDRLMDGRPERQGVARHLERDLADEIARGDVESDLLSSWPRLLEVLEGEAPRRFLSAEYEAGLRQLLAPGSLGNAWPVGLVKARLSEMREEFLGLQKAHLVARLLDHDIDSASYRRLTAELEATLHPLLRAGEFRALRKLLTSLGKLSEKSRADGERRKVAAGIIDRFYTADTIRALVAASVGRRKEESAVILEIVRAPGAVAVPLLLDALAGEKTRRVRQRLLRLLSEMGAEVAELVVQRFDDERWFVLRNLAMILGEVGSPSMVEQLAPLFAHADPRVRQEAIASAIKLGGGRTAELLRGALDDEDPAARLMALHGLGFHGDAEATARIRGLLASPNFRGRNTAVIQVAAIALGRLADQQSRPALARLARRAWFFSERKEFAREAAAWALEALDGPPERKAPDLKMLADLRPGGTSMRPRLRGGK